MYRIKDIHNKLLSLVGWDQHVDPQNQIEPYLTVSDSGLLFQESHPMVTLNNIAAVMPPDWNYQYPAWLSLQPYVIGNKVEYTGTIYIAIADNSGEQPSTGSSWKEFNPLSDYVDKLTKTGITKTVQDFVRIKQLNQETRNLFEYRQLFQGLGRLTATVNKTGSLVGIEIRNVKSMGVTTQINRIGLQVVGDSGPLTLYLFHSGSMEPVKTHTVNIAANGGYYQWFDLPEFFLDWRGGGTWYICYDETQMPLAMQAININRDWSVDPCRTCTGEDLGAWRELMKYCTFMPFKAPRPAGFETDPVIFDPALIVRTNTENYGINMQITVGCDLTDFIIQQRYLFKDALQLQVGIVALRTLANNPDVNVSRNQLNVSHLQVTYELDGSKDNGRSSSIGEQYDRSMKAIQIDTKGLDPLCLKCQNTGVRYGHV